MWKENPAPCTEQIPKVRSTKFDFTQWLQVNAHPSVVVCSHLFVSSTSMGSWSQITSILFILLPFVSSCSPGQKGPLTTQLVRPPKQQSRVQSFSGTPSAGLRASTDFRKPERSRVCVIGGDKRWRENESGVEAHRRRKKPDLLSPPKKINCRCLLADSPSAPNYGDSRKDLLSLRVFFLMHTFTNTQINPCLPTCACLRNRIHRFKSAQRIEDTWVTSPSSQSQYHQQSMKIINTPPALVALLIVPRIFASLKLFSCRVLHYGLFKVISVITEPFFGSTIICLQIFRGGISLFRGRKM